MDETHEADNVLRDPHPHPASAGRTGKMSMKCQICHQNEAQIVFTQVVSTGKVVLHICTECARNKGLSIEIEHTQPSISAASFLADYGGEKEKPEEDVPDLVCGTCGLTYAEFKESGLFGCDRCHLAFDQHVRRLLKQMHGTAVHIEAVPKHVAEKITLKQSIKELKHQLRESVKNENYERAAELRDRIAALEKEHEQV